MSCDCCNALDLPQFGFQSDSVEFRRLVERNPFIFRVHSPKTDISPLEDAFIAPKFDARYSDIKEEQLRDPPAATYVEVAKHLEWTTRHASEYISTSFSFMWAIWEALRRYHFGVKHDVEIAIIDATASVISQRAITAVEVLRSVSPAVRHPDHWKWYHHAEESQSVLVYGSIPQYAVLASVPLLKLLDALPSYCLRPFPLSPPTFPIPIARVAWFYPRPPSKASYHNFCAVQATFFAALSEDARKDDATRGAVGLAMAFLGGWAAWMVKLLAVSEDVQTGLENAEDRNMFSNAALTKVLELAKAIARWPYSSDIAEKQHEQWTTIVHELGRLVTEEIRNMETSGKVKLTPVPVRSENKNNGLVLQSGFDLPSPPLESPVDKNTTPWLERKTLYPSDLPLCSPIQRDYSHLPTPPPTPPPSLVSRSPSSVAPVPPRPGNADKCLECGLRTPTQASHRKNSEPLVEQVDAALEKYIYSEPEGHQTQAPLTPPSSPVLRPTIPHHSESPSSEPLVLAPSEADTRVEPVKEQKSESDAHSDMPAAEVEQLEATPVNPFSYSLAETASCLITGFIFGALLVAVFSQRQPARLYVS
ncbi:hypothetical protein MIND_00626500 [Mycena indigotica]|uniref:DUF7587 domain-containing protein n=1 Tax=Mycena indigotica TaxID=2126181 RepID=A0A8H6SQH6_9AGAR|nr:uncharacterized protein MIND_00626500 [Mycena indigotica]KAF7303958.1 hypothetical protein MIND_00626500 [Mycena indigotica]